MSNRLIKNGSQIEIPGDEVIVSLKIFQSNKMQLEAPTIHPRDLCKMLSGLIYDLQYASLQSIEVPKVEVPKIQM